jgi:hypothetical protein
MHIETACTHAWPNFDGGAQLLLPEDAVLNTNSYDDIYGKAQMSTSNNSNPRVIKLHGSVNWHMKDDVLHVNACTELAPADDKDEMSDQLAYHRRLRSSNIQNVPRPVVWKPINENQLPHILLPTVLKPGIDPVIQIQWRAAATMLRNADQVWFIGYSFPESDSYMRYFLASCLSDNAKIRQIAIIDPNRETFYERAPTVFADARLRSIMKMYPHSWGDLDWLAVKRGDSLHKFRNKQYVEQAELEVRGKKVHQGEYYDEITPQSPIQSSIRSRMRSRMR